MVRLPVIRRRRRRMPLMVVLVGLTATTGGASHAGDAGAGRPTERLVQKMDSDGDGALSAAEGEAAAEKMFDRRDANGQLSAAEFFAAAKQRFTAADGNGDGRVRKDELRSLRDAL